MLHLRLGGRMTGLLNSQSYLNSMSLARAPHFLQVGLCGLPGSCSVINKRLLHFLGKYGAFCICCAGQEPQREEKIAWNDLDNQLSL